MTEISYRRHRFPPLIIQDAVWLYLVKLIARPIRVGRSLDT